MYEAYDPEPDQHGRFDPRVIRHLRWWEDTRRFLRERFGLQVSPDYLFDCMAGKYQGRFSDQIDDQVEKRWYVRALRMGAFMYDGKVGVGFSCRSRRCRRIKCPLNLQRKRKDQKRLNRVDLFELMQIFYGEKNNSGDTLHDSHGLSKFFRLRSVHEREYEGMKGDLVGGS